MPAEEFSWSKLPVVKCPVRVALTNERMKRFTGEVAGVYFENGVSKSYLSHRRVSHFTAGYGAVIDVKSGVTLHPSGENRKFVYAGKHWSEYTPGGVPIDCIVTREQIDAFIAARDAEDAQKAEGEKPQPNPVWPSRTKTVVVSQAKPQNALEQDKVVDELRKEEELRAKAAQSPFDLPAEAINQDLKEAEAERLAKEQDGAEKAEDGDLAGADRDAQKLRTVLTKVLNEKGARYLRQIAAARELKTPRAGSELVEVLIASGITLDEAGKL